MGKFMHREGIACGTFKKGYCSASASMKVWEDDLTSGVDLLVLLVDRLESDWIKLPIKMRRAYGQQQIEA